MKKSAITAVLIIVSASLLTSCGGGGGAAPTPPAPVPGKTIGGSGNDLAWSVSEMTAGGYIMAGTTNSKGAGGYDAYVIKTDAAGRVIQQKTFGTTSNEFCFSIEQTTDGGYIATGFNGFDASSDPLNPELPRHYAGELFLIKMDADLNTTWTTTVSGTTTSDPSYGNASGYRVQQTSDNGYIVAGAIGNAIGGGAAYLLKTSETGSIQWTASFGDTTLATGVQEDSGSGYVASALGIASPGYLVKVGLSGSTLWNTPLGGSGEAVGKTSDGGYIVTGTTTTGNVYLAKVNSSGTVQWERSFGSPGGETGYSVQETSDQGFIIAGKGSGGGDNHGFDAYLVRTDPSGNVQWQKYFGGLRGDFGRSVRGTADGGYILGGYTNSKGAGGYDMYLIKTDSSGRSPW